MEASYQLCLGLLVVIASDEVFAQLFGSKCLIATGIPSCYCNSYCDECLQWRTVTLASVTAMGSAPPFKMPTYLAVSAMKCIMETAANVRMKGVHFFREFKHCVIADKKGCVPNPGDVPC
jgi:hypothetical protein